MSELITSKCAIIYTDFANHVGPIVLALRDRGINAVGYYGKMRESEKRESYISWKNGDTPIIVATRAFGLGINKSNVRFVIRNGLPPSISAWAQELGRAGRDEQYAEAHIFTVMKTSIMWDFGVETLHDIIAQMKLMTPAPILVKQ